MSFDHAEFLAAGSARRSARTSTQEIAPASLLRMAAVSIELLTNREEWNSYLKLLSAHREDLNQAFEQTRVLLSSPLLVNYEQLMAAKIRLAELTGAIASLDYAIGLPSEIIEAARKVPADG